VEGDGETKRQALTNVESDQRKLADGAAGDGLATERSAGRLSQTFKYIATWARCMTF